MLIKIINITDMPGKATLVKRFDGFIAKPVNIHGLAADEMLHFTHDLGRAALVVRAIKSGLAFGAFKQSITSRAMRNVADGGCRWIAFFKVNANDLWYNFAALFHVHPIVLMQFQALFNFVGIM